MQAETTILTAIRTLLDRRENGHLEVSRESDLQADLDMDSLELAELSAILEDDLGRDPYSEGIVPRTVGEIVAFYDGC